MKLKILVACLYPTLCDPVDCSLPGSSVHWILQARILEWVAISFSGYLPNPGIEPGPPVLQEDSILSEPPGNHITGRFINIYSCLLFPIWNQSVVPCAILTVAS